MTTLTAPAHAADAALSPALHQYLCTCVSERLGLQDRGAFITHMYRKLGEAESARMLCQDLREQAASACKTPGLIAVFGHVAEGLDIEAAIARQLRLMQALNKGMHFALLPAEGLLQLYFGKRRYAVLPMHEQASSLRCVMPCPMLVFISAGPGP